MANLERAEELVPAIGADPAFLTEVRAAPSPGARRAVLHARGVGDVRLEDVWAYVLSNGRRLGPGPTEQSAHRFVPGAGDKGHP